MFVVQSVPARLVCDGAKTIQDYPSRRAIEVLLLLPTGVCPDRLVRPDHPVHPVRQANPIHPVRPVHPAHFRMLLVFPQTVGRRFAFCAMKQIDL